MDKDRETKLLKSGEWFQNFFKDTGYPWAYVIINGENISYLKDSRGYIVPPTKIKELAERLNNFADRYSDDDVLSVNLDTATDEGEES